MKRVLILLTIAFLLGACGQSTPTPTPTLAPTATNLPTYTSTLPPRQVTMRANQTKNAAYAATVGARFTLTAESRRLTALVPTATRTITSTNTPTSTPGPTSTPTSIPIFSLTSHKWSPEIVLARLQRYAGDGGPYLEIMPDFILYADKHLVIRHQGKILEGYLTRQETCQVLNTIDQTGFTNYDFSWSQFYNPFDRSKSTIFVNAWQSNRVPYFGDTYLEITIPDDCQDCGPLPYDPQAVIETFQFLDNFWMGGLTPFKPNQLVVWIFDGDRYEEDGTPWPLTSPTLAELRQRSDCPTTNFQAAILLEGNEAKAFYSAGIRGLYSEGDYKASISVRPLWPYEKPPICPGGYYYKIPDPDLPLPDFTLSCTPEDGLLPIPTPAP